MRMRKLSAFRLKFRAAFKRESDPEEIQKALCISARSLCHLEKTLLNMRTISLDEYISEDEAAGVSDQQEGGRLQYAYTTEHEAEAVRS